MHTYRMRALIAGLPMLLAAVTATAADAVEVAQVTPAQLTEMRARPDAPVLCSTCGRRRSSRPATCRAP